ncbi:MAG: DUF6625 family protein [Bacteroidota bacterium]
MKIAVVICYMGKMPWYFTYFAHSCRYNPSVDFYIITDNAITHDLPVNVKPVYKTLAEINELATQKLGFEVSIKSGYKLCDFKPAYGLLFSDLLKDYDFWGHGDIDVVFGNIRSFISDEILHNNDLVVVRHDYLTGYFQLFRNNEKMNTLFMKSKDFKRVLQEEKHFCFDETNFTFEAFAEGKPPDEIPSEIESMMHVVKKMQQAGHIRAFFDFMVVEGVPGNIRWQKGELVYRKKIEILLYHMIHFKKHYHPKRGPRHIPDEFTISKKRIYHKA